MGSCKAPPLPNGFKADSLPRIGVEELAVVAYSGSLLDHPNEPMESRNVAEAIVTDQVLMLDEGVEASRHGS